MYWPPPRATRPDTPLPYTSPFRSRRDRRPARRRMTGGHAGEDRATIVPSTGETWPPGMKIVNAHLARSIREQGMLQEPNGFGYIHLAGEVERPHPLKPNGAAKRALLAALGEAAGRLRTARRAEVGRVDLFDAFVIPPGSGEGSSEAHTADLQTLMRT